MKYALIEFLIIVYFEIRQKKEALIASYFLIIKYTAAAKTTTINTPATICIFITPIILKIFYFL